MAQDRKSAFKSVLQSFNVKDSNLSRLMQMLKSDLQPILDVFSGSPDQQKIYWGQGTPEHKLPPGSVYFQTDAATTAMSTMFVKRAGEPIPVWRTIPNGIGNLLYHSLDSKTVGNAGASWGFGESEPVNGPVVVSADGSIQAATMGIYESGPGVGAIFRPAFLASGTLQAQVFINGFAVGAIIEIKATDRKSTTFEYAVPQRIPVKAGDMIYMLTKSIAALSAPSQTLKIACTMWGG